MKLLKKVLNRFNGLHYPQEYLCFSNENYSDPLHAYIVDGKMVVQDVTNLHSFVGYCPVVLAIHSSAVSRPAARIHLVFTQSSYRKNDQWNRKDALAELYLEKFQEQDIGDGPEYYFLAKKGRHGFQKFQFQWIHSLNNRLYGKRPGNVYLEGNLLKQVQIAYSIPRKISLITVGKNGFYNHFPTDLHGKAGDNHYVISLRHEGHACQQVMASGSLVLSDMMASAYKQVYALGKNHMQPLKDGSHFDFSEGKSKLLQLPLPKNVVAYREMTVVDSFIHGIHRIILFRINCAEKTDDEDGVLVHIHNAYATWRYHNGLQSNYLLR